MTGLGQGTSALARVLASNSWTPPAGARERGTVIIFGGRQETAATYERFGARIASDGYRVLLAAGDDGIELIEAVRLDELPQPLVLLGSDTGAVQAVDAWHQWREHVAGVVLGGYPAPDLSAPGDGDQQVAERTSCPLHRRVLLGSFDPSSYALPLSSDAVVRSASELQVPALVIHGEHDSISPVSYVRDFYSALPEARAWIVQQGKHDVFNDATHRSVAAVVVQFLEQLRAGWDLGPTLRPLSSIT